MILDIGAIRRIVAWEYKRAWECEVPMIIAQNLKVWYLGNKLQSLKMWYLGNKMQSLRMCGISVNFQILGDMREIRSWIFLYHNRS